MASTGRWATSRRNGAPSDPASLAGCALALTVLAAGAANAQSSVSVLTGTVVDASTKQPVAEVVVTATSPALQGEQVVLTDSTGLYRVPQLPPGVYALRFEKERHRPYVREGIEATAGRTLRLNVELLPEVAGAETITVLGASPVIDVGSSALVTTIDTDAIRVLPLSRPGGIGGANQSFESVATVAPQTTPDLYGVSINGATSPENVYLVDGLAVNDPAYHTLGSPLTTEFMEEVNVVTGGYLPEYGRATGGVLSAVTKSGGNEFHGSVFGMFAPGAMAGAAATLPGNTGVIQAYREVGNVGDVGATVGGYFIKDRLWFFAGIQWAAQRYIYSRSFSRFIDGAFEPIAGSTQRWNGDERSFNYIGKLTYLFSSDHRLSVSVSGTPTSGGGPGGLSLRDRSTARTIHPENYLASSAYSVNALQTTFDALDLMAQLNSSFLEKKLLLDVRLGWHHQHDSRLPNDGSTLDSVDTLSTLAGTPQVRSPVRFGLPVYALDPTVPDSVRTACTAPGASCDVRTFLVGGGGMLETLDVDSFQLRAVVTALLTGAGHHVLKAGFDGQLSRFSDTVARSGGSSYRNASDLTGQATDVPAVYDAFQYGTLTGADTLVEARQIQSTVHSTILGGFVQDSWSVMDVVTLNLGVRFDSLSLSGADGQTRISLDDQWSPRIGVVWDPTQQGRSRLFFNYARYFEQIPLDLASKALSPFPTVRAVHDCDPLAVGRTGCNQDSSTRLTGSQLLSGVSQAPNRRWVPSLIYPLPVDPEMKSPSVDEIVAGGDYEIIPGARLGLSYTYRNLVRTVEDMSNNDANTFFLGNPGEGIGASFPKATRTYQAITASFVKTFSEGWLAQASYTWSQLRGNYDGLFVPQTTQLDPNISSAFDLRTLLPNQDGPLSADVTHALKLFAAKEFVVSPVISLTLGAAFNAASGTPISALGGHPIYGPNQAYILVRGSAGQLPWVTSFDAKFGVSWRVSKDVVITGGVEGFNLFNSQRPIAVDQGYTDATVGPIIGAKQGSVPQQYGGICSGTAPSTCAQGNGSLPRPSIDPRSPTGAPIRVGLSDANGQLASIPTKLTWGTPTSYQPVRQFRFSLRVTF